MSADPMKSLLVAYDGSEGSRRAVEMATRLASTFDSHLVVLTAFPPYPRIGSPSKDDAREIQAARETADALVEELQRQGFSAETDVLEGPAAEAILRAADTHEADLIVVGSRGYGHFTGLLLGSTSDRVAHHATRPVLIAR